MARYRKLLRVLLVKRGASAVLSCSRVRGMSGKCLSCQPMGSESCSVPCQSEYYLPPG